MKRTAILIAAFAICTTVAAQKNIERLFSEMKTAYGFKTIDKQSYDDDSKAPTTYCYMERLVSKTKQNGYTSIFTDTYNLDTKDAYTFYVMTDVMPNSSQIRISYGVNNEYDVTFGKNSKHNYLVALFRDKENPDKRTAYALVWYETGDKTEVLIYKIYGNDPKRVKNNKRSTILTPNGTTIQYTDNGNTIISSTGRVNEIKDDLDFMKQFGTLRASFLELIHGPNVSTTLPVGIVTKIVELCKKHSHLLSDNERKTCSKSLVDMWNDKWIANEPFLKGMLEEARLALQK